MNECKCKSDQLPGDKQFQTEVEDSKETHDETLEEALVAAESVIQDREDQSGGDE